MFEERDLSQKRAGKSNILRHMDLTNKLEILKTKMDT